jgi:hypothetical protein
MENVGEGKEADDPLSKESEQEHELIAFEKELRESKVKKSDGPKLFRQLEEYLLRELRDAKRRAGKSEYCVEYLKSSFLDPLRHKHIRVQSRDKNTPPLTITYTPSIHRLQFECGATICDYTLVVGDDGVFWFDISAQTKRTIQEVVTEMLKGIETDNQTRVSPLTECPGSIRSWLHNKRAAEDRR